MSEDLTNGAKLFTEIPPICEIRRAIDADITEASALGTPKLFALFGSETIEQKIKRCYFSMIAINAKQRIVALICLDDHPNIPALPPSEWEDWINSLYKLHQVRSQNALWIHFMACDTQYTHFYTKPLLEKVFLTFPLVKYLIVVVPGGSPCFCSLEENFTCIIPNGYTNAKKVQTLYMTWRNHYTKKYKIRLAVEEDNDDIVPLIDSHSERLKEMYGEFYISELLTKHPGMDRQLIVAEIKERAVAVLILNGAANYEVLFNSFHMEPFGRIYKIDHFSPVMLQPSESSSDSDDTEKPEIGGQIFRKSIDQAANQSSSGVASLTEILKFEDIEVLCDTSNPESVHVIPKLFSLKSPEIEDARNKASIMITDFAWTHCVSDEDDLTAYTFNKESEIKDAIVEVKPIAFTLEVMAAGEEHEVAVLSDLLEASFQSFNYKEYCVFSILHDMPHFPLLDYFVKVVPRSTSTYPQELYILHKNAIKARLEVHKIHKNEFKAIKKLISHIEHYSVLLDAITKSLFAANTNLSTYVMKNYKVIVGILIVRQEKNMDYYQFNYQVYKILDFMYHKYDHFGFIEFCVMSPIYQKHMPFFLRETHRLTDMSVLFYKLDTHDLAKHSRIKPLPSILKDVIPIPDRRLPLFTKIDLQEVKVSEWLLEPKTDLFAMYASTPRTCSLPRIDINSRLVIIGDSTTGLSFIKSLIYSYDGRAIVNFNNLSLVYDKCTYATNEVSKVAGGMFVYRGKFSANHMYSVAFHSNVNYIHGAMTAINRRNKYITINESTIVPFDYLFLMCGTQYMHPFAEGIRADKVFYDCPKNVFTINKYAAADNAIQVLIQHTTAEKKRTIIIYGATIHAYCCIATLQALQLENYSLVFVEPFQHENIRPSWDLFNNPAMHEAIYDVLDITNVEVYRGYYFSDWQLYPKENFITTVKFQSRLGFITLPCDFLFFYYHKEVAYSTFSAINNAGLVYDGKVVIQPDCRTNDPNIFAAGPMTKYCRRFYADKFVHRYYSSHEIGEKLAKQVLAMLLPGSLEENDGDPIYEILTRKSTNKVVPQYTEPLIESCILPGGLNYFHIRTPGKQIPLERYLSSSEKGLIFETGNLKFVETHSDPKYFRIQFNLNNFVDQITCLTRQEIFHVNYTRLWGKHERMLNNVQKKFKMGLITNFYDFFNGSFFCAIYSDTFLNVQKEFTLILNMLTVEPGLSLVEDIVKNLVANDWHKLTMKTELQIVSRFNSSDYHTMIVDKVMEYLGRNYEILPMYAHPLVTKLILDRVNDSPLFVPPKHKK